MATKKLNNKKTLLDENIVSALRGRGICRRDGSFEFLPETGLRGSRFTTLVRTRYGSITLCERSYKLSVLIDVDALDAPGLMRVACAELIGWLEDQEEKSALMRG
mgnify:CR=1 FL=1